MKLVLKHIILALALLNIPTFGLQEFGSTMGAAISALGLVALALYYFFVKKSKPLLPLLILGLLYYSIGGFSYTGDLSFFIKNIFRYFLFIFSITEVAKNTTNKEVLYYLVIGAISVIIQALMFSNPYGRYSGLYLNPNSAAIICILGFAYSYTIQIKKQKLLAQFLFTIAGLATLSRTFIVLLVLVMLTSIFADRKNAIGIFAGAIGLLVILNTPAFELDAGRFDALQSVFSNEEIKTNTITRESRQETWALYTDEILSNIPFGNGYGSMQGVDHTQFGGKVGVHNTYLMVLGESGVIPFIFIVFFYFSLLIKSIRRFTINPEYTYLSLIIISVLMVSHNYFHNYLILFFTIWLYTRVSINMDEIKLKSD